MQPERIRRVTNKIARGLYYLEAKQPVPEDVICLMEYGGNDPEKLIVDPLGHGIREAKRTDLGPDVVSYWRNTIAGDPTGSMTWLVFYRNTAMLILTYRAEHVLARGNGTNL